MTIDDVMKEAEIRKSLRDPGIADTRILVLAAEVTGLRESNAALLAVCKAWHEVSLADGFNPDSPIAKASAAVIAKAKAKGVQAV